MKSERLIAPMSFPLNGSN